MRNIAQTIETVNPTIEDAARQHARDLTATAEVLLQAIYRLENVELMGAEWTPDYNIAKQQTSPLLFEALMTHMQGEWPDVDGSKLGDGLMRERLEFLSLRRTFSGVCSICRDWPLCGGVKMNAKEAFGLYFNDAGDRLRTKSYETYWDVVQIFLKTFPDELPTDRAVINRWLGGLTVSQNTKRNYFSTMRIIFRWLHDNHGVTDPTEGMKPPPKSRDDPPTLTTQEIDRVVNMPLNGTWGRHRERDYALLRLLRNTGIRISGALALEQSDLSDGYILVTQKGKRGYVACDNETINLLRSLGSPIFMGERGPLNYSGGRCVIKKALRLSGVDGNGICAHVMRRGFATAMNQRWMPTSTLSRMMGHTSIEQTQKYIKGDLDGLLDAYSRFSPWQEGNGIETVNKNRV